MHVLPSATPSQHVPPVMLVTAQRSCPSTTPPVSAYPTACLGVTKSLIWLLQKGRQSRTVLLWLILDRPALSVKTPRYALHMQQAVLQLSGDWVHDQQRCLLSPPMHCLSPKPEMLPLIFPAHLSAVPGCQYKSVPAGRCLVHQHISGKPIASACA